MPNIDEIRKRAKRAIDEEFPDGPVYGNAAYYCVTGDVPALCDEVERLRKERDELKKALEEYKNAYPDFYEIAVHNAKIGNEQAREETEK